MPSTIFYGAVINPESLTSYKALPRCLLAVGTSGIIDWLVEDVPEHALQETLASKGCIDVVVTEIRSGEFLIPGFVDTHTVSPLSHIRLNSDIHRFLSMLRNFPTLEGT